MPVNNCPLGKLPICECCEWKRAWGCDYPTLRGCKQLQDFNAMREVKVNDTGKSKG